MNTHTPRLCLGIALILVGTALGLITASAPVTAADRATLAVAVGTRTPEVTAVLSALTEIFRPLWLHPLAAALGLALWQRTHRPGLSLYPLAALALGTALTHALKPLFGRPRPPAADRLVDATSGAFPSGHATGIAAFCLAAAWALTVALRSAPAHDDAAPTSATPPRPRRLATGLVWATAVLLIAVIAGSRLYLGVHWLSDVTGGLLIGAGAALAGTGVRRRRAVPAPRPHQTRTADGEATLRT